jgi:hypothetical protein
LPGSVVRCKERKKLFLFCLPHKPIYAAGPNRIELVRGEGDGGGSCCIFLVSIRNLLPILSLSLSSAFLPPFICLLFSMFTAAALQWHEASGLLWGWGKVGDSGKLSMLLKCGFVILAHHPVFGRDSRSACLTAQVNGLITQKDFVCLSSLSLSNSICLSSCRFAAVDGFIMD